jgi:rod shape-determining protein MreD
MNKINNTNKLNIILLYSPTIILFLSVLNEFDFNFLKLNYFSFNFNYILIFYYSLKKSKSLGYGLIFIAGLFNDAITGTPIGLTALNYLLICGFAGYLRNITLRPNIIKDWIFFLVTISVVNSFSYTLLTLVFSFQLDYYLLLINIFFTFLFYLFFSHIFGLFDKLIFGGSHD